MEQHIVKSSVDLVVENSSDILSRIDCRSEGGMSLTSAKKLDSCLANDDSSAAVVLKKHVYSPISDYEVVPGFFDLEHVAARSCYPKNCTVYTICNPTASAAAAATANCASCSCEKGLSCFPTKSTIVKKIQFLRALTSQSSASIAPNRRKSYNLKKRWVEDMMQSSSEDCDPVKLKSAESTSSGAATTAAQLETNQSDERNHNKGTTVVVLKHYYA